MDVNPVPRPAAAARPRRSLAGLAIVAALALAMASPGAVFAWDASSYSSADEQLLVTLTNQARAAAGLPALKVDPALVDMARWRSKDMIDRNYFSHSIPPDGKKVFDYLTASGYCFKLAGENLGTNNFPDDIATETIQQGFMDSPGHRANILGADWGVVGIGAYKGADGKHMWAVLFADKCGAAATPKPTATLTPVPTATPVPRPTQTPGPVTTPRPTTPPTAAPQPVATPKPTPEPTVAPPVATQPAIPAPTVEPRAGGTPEPTPGPTPSGNPPSVAEASPAPEAASGTLLVSLRVVDAPFPTGLVDQIVGDVAGGFFGN